MDCLKGEKQNILLRDFICKQEGFTRQIAVRVMQKKVEAATCFWAASTSCFLQIISGTRK